MAENETKFNRRRLRSSYITSVVSISMVLLVLGLLGWMLVNAKQFSDKTRESFTVSIFFRDSVDDLQILNFKEELDRKEFVKSTKFVTRAEAAENYQQEVGVEFVDLLGYNPLPASIDVNFKPEFAGQGNFDSTEEEWMRNPMVEKVSYQRVLIGQVVDNMKKLSWFFIAFSAILTLISVTLINNTIRLSIYSRRFLIKTMLLVGATQGFIRRPFLRSGLLQGFLAGLLAIFFIAGIMLLAERQFPELKDLRNFRLLGMLAGALLLGGVILSWICTFFAVRKYLNLKTDSLY